MHKPSPEFLASLAEGDRLLIDQGANGIVRGKVTRITAQLIFVRFGKETRRFAKADGGTFQAPCASRSWLMPLEAAHA